MLLILAGIALATLTGQGNIIGNAENAVGKYNNSVASEQQFLNEIEKYFQNYLKGENSENPKPSTGPVDENGLATENTIITTDEENVQIVIPKGFAPAILKGSDSTYSLPGQDGSVKEIMPYEQWSSITSEQINQGIVIVDYPITYDNGQEEGTIPDFNEYVWVPVPNFNDFKRTAWTTLYGQDSNGEIVEGTGVTQLLADEMTENYFWEDKSTEEYKNMLKSVEINKGFYIGRYEATDNGSSIAESKRNIQPWVVEYDDNIIEACKNNTIENMHLMYGIEWDTILNWLMEKAIISSAESEQTKDMELEDIENSSNNWGNYIDSVGDASIDSGIPVKQTGYSEYWKANNIYDLAGNIDEYTQEWYSTDKRYTARGGPCYLPFAVATRTGKTYGGDFGGGFRASFFISIDE